MAKRQKSVNKYSFNEVPRANIQRSRFDRSHAYKTAFDAGLLVPFYVDECLPGDTFSLSANIFARLATPLKPLMDNMYLETFFFAVPNRLIWDNWEKFNGQQDNPGDSTDYLIPTISAPGTGFTQNQLMDYMGVPTNVPGLTVNALHKRGYHLIWNEFFRDENLQDSITVPKDDAPETGINPGLLRRGKRHDYFTSCLPWPQKGEAVEIPLGGQAPISGLGVVSPVSMIDTDVECYEFGQKPNDPKTTYPFAGAVGGDGFHNTNIYLRSQGSSPANGALDVYADLTNATAITINSLRESFQIQKLYERDARGGTRYTEIIKSHFGVTSPDSRLQRPEYLGGGSSPVNITAIAQTSETNPDGDTGENTPQGNLAAMGTASANGHGFTKSFTEHCILIGLVCVRADLTYQQGLNRMWSRQTRFDFYWPALSHLGEQEVLEKEIYAQGNDEDDKVFGYQERYAEYRYKPSIITGLFRSNSTQPLDYWHLSQEFENAPALNDEFIQENPPVDRIVAVPSEPHFIFDSFINLKCARPMPTYSVPGLIDHF